MKEKVSKITNYKYKDGEYEEMIEDLLEEIEHLKEELEYEKKDKEENYRQLTPSEMGWE